MQCTIVRSLGDLKPPTNDALMFKCLAGQVNPNLKVAVNCLFLLTIYGETEEKPCEEHYPQVPELRS